MIFRNISVFTNGGVPIAYNETYTVCTVEKLVKTSFRSITWIAFVLLIALGSIDTAMAQNATLNPTNLVFCVANTSAATQSQTIAVGSTSSTQAVFYTANASPSTYLSVSPSSGTTSLNGTLTVTVTPANLPSGSSASGIVQVTANGVTTTANVTIMVGSSNCTPTSGGTLTANPTSINFTPTSAQQQNVSIGGTSGNLTATANYGNGPSQWFTFSQFASNSYTITAASAPPSGTTYSGSIVFNQTGTNLSVTVPVTYTTTGTGTGVLAASPTAINVNFVSNTSAASTQTVNISTTNQSTPNITAFANLGNGPANWIRVNASPQLVPATELVTIDPTNLIAGVSYSGSVTFTDQANANNTVTVPVSATVGSSTLYSASPNPLTFTIPAGTQGNQVQNLTINGPSGAMIGISASATSPYQWLFAGSSSGTLTNGQGTLQVSVNASQLTSGQTYSGYISITQFGTSTEVLRVPVTVTVSGNPTLTITPAPPTPLSFGFQIGQSPPPPQTISVSSPPGTFVNFSVIPTATTCGGNWLVVSPTQTSANGSVPTSINVSINTAGLTTSTNCSGNIQISAPGASNSTTNIPVNLLVSTNPLMSVSPSSLTFTTQPGGGLPQAQSVTVSSSSTPLPFNVAVTANTSGGPIFLTANQSTATTPATVMFSINPSVYALLAPGTYVDNIAFTSSAAGNSPVTIQATLTISNTAIITVNPTSLVMNYQIGQSLPPNQTITVASTGAPVTYTAAVTTSNCGNFLSVFPTTGSTQSSLAQNGTPVSVQASVTGLTTPITCSGTISFTTPNSSTPIPVNVTLNVVSTPAINLSVNSIVQTVNAAAPTPTTVGIALTSTDASSGNPTPIPFLATVSTNPPGQAWVSLFPQTGITPNNLTVQFNPANLPPGIYNATITVTDTRSNAPIPPQMIPITLTVAAQATVTPTMLTFTMPQGGPNAASQNITVGGVPTNTTIAASATTSTCTQGWLTTSVTGTTVTVGISGLTLTPATCTGQVTIIVPGASNSPLTVPVTLNVTNAVSLALSTTNVTFNSTAGSTTAPASQTVTVATSNNSAVPFTTALTTSGAVNFLTVTPTSGTTPATLTLAISPTVLATLNPGTYSGAVTISSPNVPGTSTINVTLNVAALPAPAITSVVNAATQQPGAISPGELITIYGTNLGPAQPVGLQLTASGSVATTLGNTQVMFDTTQAPLIYVSATQINAIVPYEMAGRAQMTVTVIRGGVVSNGIQLLGTTTSPGIFTLDASGRGQGAILNQTGTVNGPNTPAPKGSVISIYATGEGQLNPPGVTGSVTSVPYPKPSGAVSLVFVIPGPNGTTTSVPATLTYAGEAPSLVSGVLQVNAVVPASLPSGSATLVLTVGNNSSPSVVTVQVQ